METARPPLVFPFDAGQPRPSGDLTSLLGGKGAGLASMAAMGLPVPPGFTLTTEACRRYADGGWTDDLDTAVRAEIGDLERRTGKRFGDANQPLLVSVRSGAAVSMPGMMDTVLDVGITPAVEDGLAVAAGDPAFAVDTHRRGLLSFAEVVAGATASVDGLPQSAGPTEIRRRLAEAGITVPDDPVDQVIAAVRAVFASWWSERAGHYRAVEGIADDLGTAATVQAMVFGNLGADSGTGVAFSRDPSSGEPGLMGDFLPAAQGEDVVAGRRRTRPVADMAARWPDVHEQLRRIADQLEHHYADMVDIEFTVERGRLWILQARRGKRSPLAAFRAAADMAEDAAFPVDRAEAVRRCRAYLEDPPTLTASAGDDADDRADAQAAVIATGQAAAPGGACGVLCTDVDDATSRADNGVEVVLVRRETSPADVAGMIAAAGLVTVVGGLVSHAAVVARSWGLPAVVGADGLEIVDGGIRGPGGHVDNGAVVTVDGDAGRLLLGEHARRGVEPPEVTTIRTWSREIDGSSETPSVRDPGPTPPPADHRFLTLHAIRIKGMATVEVLSAMTALTHEQLLAQLEVMIEDGGVDHLPARGLYRITARGRRRHADALASAVAALDLSALPYDEFLELNHRLKALCTDWQLRDGAPNDHADPDYDGAIVEALGRLHDDARPVISACGAVTPWMCRYGDRLTAARDRVVAGDPKAFTGVMCDSYHDIWMELHEDLILTQGIDRAEEGSS